MTTKEVKKQFSEVEETQKEARKALEDSARKLRALKIRLQLSAKKQ